MTVRGLVVLRKASTLKPAAGSNPAPVRLTGATGPRKAPWNKTGPKVSAN